MQDSWWGFIIQNDHLAHFYFVPYLMNGAPTYLEVSF